MEVNPHWECLKKTWTSTCEEVLGKKKRQHKDWISLETINKLQARKEKKSVLNNSRTRSTKSAAHEQYTVANRAVKKSVKTDKVNFIDSLAKEAEGNMKQLYDTTRKLAGKFKQAERPIKEKNGVILTSEEDQMGRWREIPTEAIKADMETSIEMLYDMIGKIWETDEIPMGWKEGCCVLLVSKTL